MTKSLAEEFREAYPPSPRGWHTDTQLPPAYWPVVPLAPLHKAVLDPRLRPRPRPSPQRPAGPEGSGKLEAQAKRVKRSPGEGSVWRRPPYVASIDGHDSNGARYQLRAFAETEADALAALEELQRSRPV
jgi:hypothetical protein